MEIYKDGICIKLLKIIPLYIFFSNLIKSYNNPFSHGTQKGYLKNILKYGLGSKYYLPKNSTNLDKVGLCSLKYPDALIASYAFATRGDLSELRINNVKQKRKKIIDKYIKMNPRLNTWYYNVLLKFYAFKYSLKRGKLNGYPIILIYNFDKIETISFENKFIPSEAFHRGSPIMANLLKLVLVPAKYVASFKVLLSSYGIYNKILIFPLELIEFIDIYNLHIHVISND